MSERRRQKCTAKCKATGNRCERWAVDGYNVCYVHGAGGKKKPGGRPVKTGMHSKVLRKKLSAKVEEYLGNDNLLNMRVNIALKRALLDELLAKRKKKGKKLNIATINNATQLLNSISQDIERLDKMEHGSKHTLSISVLHQTVSIIVQVIDKHVPSEKTKDRIFSELAEYGLGSDSGSIQRN
jgi:hypothetical protein